MSTENLSSVLNDELSIEDREQGYVKDDSGLGAALLRRQFLIYKIA